MRVPSVDVANSCSTTSCEASKRGGRLLIRVTWPDAASMAQSAVGSKKLSLAT